MDRAKLYREAKEFARKNIVIFYCHSGLDPESSLLI